MSPTATLPTILAPRVLALRNVLRRRPFRPFVVAALACLLWVACFFVFTRTLDYFQTIGEFGPALTSRGT